jgi:hypothetical protein
MFPTKHGDLAIQAIVAFDNSEYTEYDLVRAHSFIELLYDLNISWQKEVTEVVFRALHGAHEADDTQKNSAATVERLHRVAQEV